MIKDCTLYMTLTAAQLAALVQVKMLCVCVSEASLSHSADIMRCNVDVFPYDLRYRVMSGQGRFHRLLEKSSPERERKLKETCQSV